MTVLAVTAGYVVEYENYHSLLTIARRTDGHCLAWQGRGVAGEFRDCIRTHGADRAIATYIRMARDTGWSPLYKPAAMVRNWPIVETANEENPS